MTKKQRQIIEDITVLVKTQYEHESSGHDWLHLKRVTDLAKKINAEEHADDFTVIAAALLHDVDDYKFKPDGESDYFRLTQIGNQVGISDADLQLIILAVSTVSYKGAGVPTEPLTKEGAIVQDADRLDAIGAIGIARCFAYGATRAIPMYDETIKPILHTSFEAYKTNSPSINHFTEKLLLLKNRMNTNAAKRIAKERHSIVKKFYDQFIKEVRGES